MNDIIKNAVYGNPVSTTNRAGTVIKCIIGVVFLILFCLVMWTLALQIAQDNMRKKQIEHDQKFQVMADALFLEVTEAEWKARGNRSVLEVAK